MKQTFGQLLRELRRSKSISQRELADKAGVDFTYISKVENDRLPPPAAETLVKIATVLTVPQEILLSASGKIDNETKEVAIQSPEAIKFLTEVKQMNLTKKEWDSMFMNLRNLR